MTRPPFVGAGFKPALSPRPQPLRPLEEIRADILALERETEGLLAEIVSL